MLQRTAQDRLLGVKLNRLREAHEDHWAYRYAARANQQTLFQYPAMMVADMQRDLASALLTHRAKAVGPLFDPFVGSGTTLSAAMSLGRDFVGWDINPLAVLISRVKAGPLHIGAFADAAKRVGEVRTALAPDERFENWRYWFTDEVARALTALRQAIAAEPNPSTRRFLWVCLAETVRLTSNSRTSTVKLHRRPIEQIACRPNPMTMFGRVAEENLRRLSQAAQELTLAGHMSRGWYRGNVTIRLGDCRELTFNGPAAAVLITSPPYGDNTSTVPYGQHAYLPLQWIDLPDIDTSACRDYLATTHEIDRRSLGGSKRITVEQRQTLIGRSPVLADLLKRLTNAGPDRSNRVIAFTRDLDDALARVLPMVKRQGLTAWTVGSRRVGGQLVLLNEMLPELASAYGYAQVETLHREIPANRKRMASRNNEGFTMSREYVVILRRR
jgi:hypothetical protein